MLQYFYTYEINRLISLKVPLFWNDNYINEMINKWLILSNNEIADTPLSRKNNFPRTFFCQREWDQIISFKFLFCQLVKRLKIINK